MVQDIKGPLIVCLVINRRIILTIGIDSVLHQLNPNLKLARVKDCIDSVLINDLVLNCDEDEGCQICHVVVDAEQGRDFYGTTCDTVGFVLGCSLLRTGTSTM
eukprot:scaffold1387_cov191-Alexandrium_tamarense.AAC.2